MIWWWEPQNRWGRLKEELSLSRTSRNKKYKWKTQWKDDTDWIEFKNELKDRRIWGKFPEFSTERRDRTYEV